MRASCVSTSNVHRIINTYIVVNLQSINKPLLALFKTLIMVEGVKTKNFHRTIPVWVTCVRMEMGERDVRI